MNYNSKPGSTWRGLSAKRLKTLVERGSILFEVRRLMSQLRYPSGYIIAKVDIGRTNGMGVAGVSVFRTMEKV